MDININGPMFVYTIIILIILVMIYYVIISGNEPESFTDKEKNTIAKITMENKDILKNSKQSYTDLKQKVPLINAPAFDTVNFKLLCKISLLNFTFLRFGKNLLLVLLLAWLTL